MDEKIFYDKTDFGENSGGSGWFPKTDFSGSEEIEIPTESPYEGGIDGVKGGNIATLRIDEFGRFVSDRLEMAFTTRQSGIGKSLRYYIGVGTGAEILGSKSVTHLKSLSKELDACEDFESRKKVLEETTRFLRGLQIKKQGG